MNFWLFMSFGPTCPVMLIGAYCFSSGFITGTSYFRYYIDL